MIFTINDGACLFSKALSIIIFSLHKKSVKNRFGWVNLLTWPLKYEIVKKSKAL